MVAFYKHDIAAWRGGTASLTHEQYRVYHVLVEQMMLEEGSILVHERMLSGLANMSTRSFRAVVDELVRGGKVFRDGDRLANGRVETELSAVRQNRQNASLGGRSRPVRDQFTTSSAEKKSRTGREHSANTPRTGRDVHGNPNEINGAGEAPLNTLISLKEKRREEVEKKEAPLFLTTFEKEAADEPPAIQKPDPRKELFDRGIELIVQSTGRPSSAVRSLVGRWLKHSDDNAVTVLRAIEAAIDYPAADPVSWIERRLNFKRDGTGPPRPQPRCMSV